MTRVAIIASILVGAFALAAPATAEAPQWIAIDEAVQQVRQEVEHGAWAIATQAQRPANRPELAAVATLTHVLGRVSAAVYGYRARHGMELPLGGTVDAVADVSLSMQAGLCGNAAMAASAILERLGVPTRIVQMYHGENVHVGLEARWGGGWHYLDPTWGVFYRHRGRILPLDAVMRLTPAQRSRIEVRSRSLYWRFVVAQLPGARAALTPVGERPLRVVWAGNERNARVYR